MPRCPRDLTPGTVHHVTARSVWGELLFRDDDDRLRYLALLTALVSARGTQVLTYCLMSNHVHILVRVPNGDLADGMRILHGTYAREYNRRHARRGHVFDGRYKARSVRDERHLVACLRYIARNPLAAGMCADAADYRWSAHRALLGLDQAPAFIDVRAAFDFALGGVVGGREYYARLVAGDGEGLTSDLARRFEAERIAVLRDAGAPVPVIADQLGVGSISTVYRRMRRLRDEGHYFL